MSPEFNSLVTDRIYLNILVSVLFYGTIIGQIIFGYLTGANKLRVRWLLYLPVIVVVVILSLWTNYLGMLNDAAINEEDSAWLAERDGGQIIMLFNAVLYLAIFVISGFVSFVIVKCRLTSR